jgi:hypothetical protein
MIAADNETCGGVVINQTNVTCPQVIACITAQPTGAPATAGTLVLGSDAQFHALAGQDPYATAAQSQAGTSLNTIINPADLFARENIPISFTATNQVSTTAAPLAGESYLRRNSLNEVYRWIPSGGFPYPPHWELIASGFSATTGTPTTSVPNTPAGTVATIATLTVPRSGTISLSGRTSFFAGNPAVGVITQTAAHIRKNGVVVAAGAGSGTSQAADAVGDPVHYFGFNPSIASLTVTANDVLTLTIVSTTQPITPNVGDPTNLTYVYLT